MSLAQRLRTGLRAADVLPVREPPLADVIAAGRLREAEAALTAERVLVKGCTADEWPDPYGPDPVVFGREPRVKEVTC